MDANFCSLFLYEVTVRKLAMIAGEDDNTHYQNQDFPLSLSLRHVNYSCGSCGYNLNLSSCNRNASMIDAKYKKSIKRGIISFFTIDESRFNQIEELRWTPYFNPKYRWGLFQRRTRLLCHKCGKHIGNAYKESTSSSSLELGKSHLIPWDGMSDGRTYDMKIRALQPSYCEDLRIC
ncbi:hypothetical protein HS088_TW03G01005 [Tripterygium wilfordii]|uniref:Uncharacterized protein n=1 Tax=Tripterygium wilfordii TaxID=458696 RepID=A0A7J7DX40_TRIWF|nr:uncharacterized protein At4g08330, chloroplastic-like [Tripterygium wilfordii]KAF5750666.1 hypothetical protein HS088_TW03G01005 [Tripterygium wilfordii]